MNRNELRQPVQKRAIEKKQKIIECGFNLMCKKGYYNVDCIQIAKASDVSTGTVYQYFKDKRDIFLQGLKQYSDSMLFPILELRDKEIKKSELRSFFEKIIMNNVKVHKMSKATHEEIMAMRHSDQEVNEIFHNFELKATDVLVDIFNNNNFVVKNVYEKSHLIIGWIDNLCHEITYHKHKGIDYDAMTQIVLNEIVHVITEKD